jgi:hypothetical protein
VDLYASVVYVFNFLLVDLTFPKIKKLLFNRKSNELADDLPLDKILWMEHNSAFDK